MRASACSSIVFRPAYRSPFAPHSQQPGSASSTHSTSHFGHQTSGSTSTVTHAIFPVAVDMPFEVSVDSLIEAVDLLVDSLNRPSDAREFTHVRVVLVGVRSFESSQEPHDRPADYSDEDRNDDRFHVTRRCRFGDRRTPR